jgi:uncharacterized protein involved in outer membrane biogenesis
MTRSRPANAMSIMRKRNLFFLIALAVVIGLLAQTFNILAGRNRDLVQQELQKVLGKDVSFARLEATVLGGFGFSAKEFRIADDPRFAATPFVRAKELILEVSVPNLFLGKVVIDSLTFKDPEIQIITDEAGLMNLAELANAKKELGAIPKWRMAAPDKKRAAASSTVSFLVTRLRIRNGRIVYIDRSVKEPAEMQVKNVEMDVKGLDPAAKTTIKFAAAVSEGLGHDVRIEGAWGPAGQTRGWSQQPVDLKVQFDSLHVPLVARAVAFLRNKIPRELDATGPLSFQARWTGTLEQPQIKDIKLKAPLFGSSDYNAILEGAVEFAKGRAWDNAQLNGTLTLARVDLAQLRNLPLLKQTLPATLATEGAVSVRSRFEGTWPELRLGVLIDANRGGFRYRDWLHKPAGSPVQLRAGISRRKDGFILHPSELTFGSSKIALAGVIKQTPQPRLLLNLRGARSSIAAWSRLFPQWQFRGTAGSAAWDIVLDRNFVSADGDWDLRGQLKLTEAEFRHKESGRKIENLNAEILLLGKQARVENATFRLGSSTIAMALAAPSLLEPRASYQLRSAELNLSDLPGSLAGAASRLKQVTISGDLQVQNGLPMLRGSIASADGSLQQIAYRNLRAEVAWSATGISFKNLSLQALNGTLRSDGYWVSGGDQSQRLEVMPQLESVQVRPLLMQRFPQIGDRIDGLLDLRGRFDAIIREGATLPEALKGTAEALIHRGTIKDFNLIAQLFRKGGGSATGSKIAVRLPASLTESLNRSDTPFDAVKANFTLDQQLIRTDNLLLSTPDYEIMAAGWIAFDRTTRWNGLLILSPQITQEFVRENKMIRYLLDRRGRMAVPFKVEGTFPTLRARPDNRALAQAVRRGSLPRGVEPPPIREKRSEQSERRESLPEPLEQLLNP